MGTAEGIVGWSSGKSWEQLDTEKKLDALHRDRRKIGTLLNQPIKIAIRADNGVADLYEQLKTLQAQIPESMSNGPKGG
jgi:hypothetical protein